VGIDFGTDRHPGAIETHRDTERCRPCGRTWRKKANTGATSIKHFTVSSVF
jgi:hypothetical protein